MEHFIAGIIIDENKKSKELGLLKYQAYFVNTSIYLMLKDKVDAILSKQGLFF